MAKRATIILTTVFVATIMIVSAGCRTSAEVEVGGQVEALRPLVLARAAERQADMQWQTGEESLAGIDNQAPEHVRSEIDRRRALAWSASLTRGPRLFSMADEDEGPAAIQPLSAESADGGEMERVRPGATDLDVWWQRPLAGRTMREVIWDDVKLLPRELWKSTKDTATVPGVIILGAAGGLSAVSRHNWDEDADDYFRTNRTAWSHDGDFGGFISNPFLHFGMGLAGYGLGVYTENDEMYGFSKTLLQALMLNGMITQGMKWVAHDRSPNGEMWAWPSGHTSHAVTVAAVVYEYYGPWYGVPAYLLAGWGGVSRINDREHWMSDVIMGFAIGSVVGHSVARGRMVEVGGFTMMPYVPRDGGAGIMFVRKF